MTTENSGRLPAVVAVEVTSPPADGLDAPPDRGQGRRDLSREMQFLTGAADGRAAFVDHAEARLWVSGGQPRITWGWRDASVLELLDEIREEAADLGAWAALAAQALDFEPVSADQREAATARLAEAVEHAAKAHELASAVAAALDGKAAA